MLKLTVAVLAVAIAGAAAAGWRDLRIDASSEAAFSASLATFQSRLSPSREHAFKRALQDILSQSAARAATEQRDYTPSELFAQLDGLSYEQVVRIAAPTGHQAKRYRAEYYSSRAGGWTSPATAAWSGGAGLRWGTRTSNSKLGRRCSAHKLEMPNAEANDGRSRLRARRQRRRRRVASRCGQPQSLQAIVEGGQGRVLATDLTAKERYRATTRENVADTTRPVAPWQGQYHGSKEAKSEIAHDSLDAGELMRTRPGGTVTPHSNEATCCRQQ